MVISLYVVPSSTSAITLYNNHLGQLPRQSVLYIPHTGDTCVAQFWCCLEKGWALLLTMQMLGAET